MVSSGVVALVVLVGRGGGSGGGVYRRHRVDVILKFVFNFIIE